MVDEALKDSRFRLDGGGIEINSKLSMVLNSRGTHKLEREALISWSLMGMASDGERLTSFDYFQNMSRQALRVEEKIIASTRALCDRLIRNLTNGRAKSYRGLVGFSPRAVAEIFFPVLSYHLNGRTLVEKTGKWTLKYLGNRVLSPLLNLEDLPLLPDRFGFCVFDREGVPTRPVQLISEGFLKEILTDAYAGTALGRPLTGSAAGHAAQVPSVAPHSLTLRAGARPLEQLLHDTETKQREFLLIHRFSGQSDPVTGDFSGVAKGGEWWIGGESAYTVQETLISGNVFDCLGSALCGVSYETEVVDAAEESPWIFSDGVSVTSEKSC